MRFLIFILIAVQNNAKRSKCIKIKIDYTLKNSKSSFYGDRDELVKHIIWIIQ